MARALLEHACDVGTPPCVAFSLVGKPSGLLFVRGRRSDAFSTFATACEAWPMSNDTEAEVRAMMQLLDALLVKARHLDAEQDAVIKKAEQVLKMIDWLTYDDASVLH